MKEQSDNSEAYMDTKVEVLADGPMLVHGSVIVHTPDGKEEIKQKTTAFCRCGESANKPYCDGTHGKIGFKG